MDIERMKKLLKSKIEAGNKIKAVREVIKTYKTQKQDMYDDTTEILKPSIDAQKSVKESIDEKQDKVIKELQKNQQVLKSGLEDIAMMNALPALQGPIETTKLPIDYKPTMMDDIDGTPKDKLEYKSDLDKGFTSNEIQKLTYYQLPPPSQILKSHIAGSINIDEFDKEIGKQIKKLGSQKGSLSKTKKTREKNKEQIDDLTGNIKLLRSTDIE